MGGSSVEGEQSEDYEREQRDRCLKFTAIGQSKGNCQVVGKQSNWTSIFLLLLFFNPM